MLFVGAKPLHARNGIASVNVQAAVPHALAPALPARNDGIGMNGSIPFTRSTTR
jgi:hypothetical protein